MKRMIRITGSHSEEPLSRMICDFGKHKQRGRHPFLAMSISKRLALGFLIPLLIVFLGLGNIGIQSVQLLSNVTTFNQHLLHAYTSLTSNVAILQQTHTNILGALNDAEKSQVTSETLREDRLAAHRLAASYDSNLHAYLQQDVLLHAPELAALFKESGHGEQLDAQLVYSNDASKTWSAYRDAFTQVFDAISTGSISTAQRVESNQVELAYANAMTSLLVLVQFTDRLAPSIHDATMVEEHQLLVIMLLSVCSLLLGMAIVGWLVSSTLVRRLQRFQAVVQSVEHGQFSARIEVDGRDEIAMVGRAVNTTLDAVVGLLDETKRQRDELAKGEELKKLHEALQCEHEALNEANRRLSTLATTDVLT
ncbi:MAG TPA: hypothetical protein DHW02_00105, partial [Ktedonobacter sp.]|nr:hypothetical protein [Ktedonobacter sp.]